MSARYVVRISPERTPVNGGDTAFDYKGSLKRYESDPLDRKRASVLFRSTKSLMREIERYLRDRGLAEVMDTE